MVMRAYSIAVFLFLYVPIGIIVLFSFNSGRHASDFQGFSPKWYGKALSNPFMMDALTSSLIIAFSAAILASLMGTAAALALQRLRGPVKAVFDGLIYISIMIPGIVIGIATLVALVTVFDVLNPALAALWPGEGRPPRLSLGYLSVIAAHTLFTMSLVIVLVRARIAGMDRTPDRGVGGSLCHAMANLLPGHAAANLSGHTGGLPVEFHLQLRRFHHFVFCRWRQYHIADLRLLLNSTRHHAGGKRNRNHCPLRFVSPVDGSPVPSPCPRLQNIGQIIRYWPGKRTRGIPKDSRGPCHCWRRVHRITPAGPDIALGQI